MECLGVGGDCEVQFGIYCLRCSVDIQAEMSSGRLDMKENLKPPAGAQERKTWALKMDMGKSNRCPESDGLTANQDPISQGN